MPLTLESARAAMLLDTTSDHKSRTRGGGEGALEPPPPLASPTRAPASDLASAILYMRCMRATSPSACMADLRTRSATTPLPTLLPAALLMSAVTDKKKWGECWCSEGKNLHKSQQQSHITRTHLKQQRQPCQHWARWSRLSSAAMQCSGAESGGTSSRPAGKREHPR